VYKVPIREIKMEIPAKRNLFSNNVLTHDREHFRSSYAGSPPWDIGKPQPAFRAAADKVVGSVLDAGCGTGEHALFFAARGHAVTGFHFLEEPIAAAKRKAVERSLIVKFLVPGELLFRVTTGHVTLLRPKRPVDAQCR
jgi:2-polyprenyl-3-methyl-5-hydroxy-6-metoxy-1,4-benzoquinol methylase